MKTTKAMIYAEYGITFKDGKILSPIGWIRPLLKKGNKKLGTGIYTFSTLPTNKFYKVTVNGREIEIKGTCPCHCPGCYATKGRYQMYSVINSLGINTYLCIYYLDFVKTAILAQVAADHIEFVRIHAAGDFFSVEYVIMWKDVCKACPLVTFWTYTKFAPAEHAFDDIINCNIVASLIPGYGMNYGHCDYIMNTYSALMSKGEQVYICRCGVDKRQHCTNCKGCSVNKYVLFIEHSTDYKAETDLFFETLKNIIESQKDPV